MNNLARPSCLPGEGAIPCNRSSHATEVKARSCRGRLQTWTSKVFSSSAGVSIQSSICTTPISSHQLRSESLIQQLHASSRGLYLKSERRLAVLHASKSNVSSDSTRSLDSDDVAELITTRAKASPGPISSMRFGGERLRHRFALLGGGKSRGSDGFVKLGFGGRAVAVAAAEGEAREAEVVADAVANEVDPEENSSFPAEFKELIVDSGDPPNLYLYAAGLVVVVLMRDVIIQEFARWGINFARIALYIAEGITVGVTKLMDVGAEPISLLMTLATWAATTLDAAYTVIVDAPVTSLATSLFLSLAVLSIGDAATREVKGARSQLVGVAAAIGVAGVLGVIPSDVMLFSLVALTAYAHFVQKADLVTVFMPATVTFVAIAAPVVRAAAFGLFLVISVYANWRSARQKRQQHQQQPSDPQATSEAKRGKSPLSPLFSAITASICISLSTRFLGLRTVQWLLLRST